MFDITLITMGKLKEKFYLSAAAEYTKRLSRFGGMEVIECPDPIIRLGVQFHPERMNDEKRNFFWHWLEMLA